MTLTEEQKRIAKDAYRQSFPPWHSRALIAAVEAVLAALPSRRVGEDRGNGARKMTKNWQTPFTEREILRAELMLECEAHICGRFLDWISNPNRKDAQTAFTAGPMRDLAKEIEFMIWKMKEPE